VVQYKTLVVLSIPHRLLLSPNVFFTRAQIPQPTMRAFLSLFVVAATVSTVSGFGLFPRQSPYPGTYYVRS
jgi:hypothetical protein